MVLNNETLELLADKVAERVLEKMQEDQQPLMTRGEVIEKIGRGEYEKALINGSLNKIKKGGKTSTVFIARSEFNLFVKHPRTKLHIHNELI